MKSENKGGREATKRLEMARIALARIVHQLKIGWKSPMPVKSLKREGKS